MSRPKRRAGGRRRGQPGTGLLPHWPEEQCPLLYSLVSSTLPWGSPCTHESIFLFDMADRFGYAGYGDRSGRKEDEMSSKLRKVLSLLLAAGVLVAFAPPGFAGELPVTVGNLFWEPNTGLASFEFVNTSDQAVTAWCYAKIFRYLDGEEIVTWYCQEAAAGAGLAEVAPAEFAAANKSLQPGERRTHETRIIAPTYKKEGLADPPLELEVVALVFFDTSALGDMFWVEHLRDSRLGEAKELALWLHAIKDELYAKDSDPSFQRLFNRMSIYNEKREPFSRVNARGATNQMRRLLADVESGHRSSEDALQDFEKAISLLYDGRLLHLTLEQRAALIPAEWDDLAALPETNLEEE